MSEKTNGNVINASTFRIIKEPRYYTYQQWVTGGIAPQSGNKAPDHWADVGYYGKLSDLVIYLVNQHIEVPDSTLQTQVKDLLAEIKRVESSILEQLKAHE